MSFTQESKVAVVHATRRSAYRIDKPRSRAQARLARFALFWKSLRRNPLTMLGLGIVTILIAVALLGPALSPYDPVSQDLAMRLMGPSANYWLGTDELGRDIFSRILHGARITLSIIVLVVGIAAPFGLVLGCVSGYLGGWLDIAIMRITDIFLAFPRLILALALVAALGPGIENAVIAIALTSWPVYARVARARRFGMACDPQICDSHVHKFNGGPCDVGHGRDHSHCCRAWVSRSRGKATVTRMGCNDSRWTSIHVRSMVACHYARFGDFNCQSRLQLAWRWPSRRT